ncbi:hypothetical protein PHLCEN_2v13386 [Hermanssonia centrifuga]|uniref:Uncharacterized protein n=1 Tax=Hermanssonia centrifuga TaxID=98765 RepID=A0A2R6NEJ6_9APHY|nr:hypothetical protein PHLCEN_2v13386 [Hermanssonia centrifuga]
MPSGPVRSTKPKNDWIIRKGSTTREYYDCRIGKGFTVDTHLVDEILAVVITELLRPDYAMQIGLHQFLYKIYFFEIIE